jgi:hypothetical protein
MTMSDHPNEMTGADLEHLEHLAGAYGVAGREIAARAAELRRRIGRTVAEFDTTTEVLRAETGRAAALMEEEIAALAATAAGVAWTGANRLAFDEELQRFATSVRSGAAALVDGVARLRAAGVTPFTAFLDDFGAATAAAGDGVEAATADLRRLVEHQRAELHAAAGGGWMAV